MDWLPWPVLPKRQWPPIRYKEKRAITRDEHELILSRESNPEMRAFLWCCWHIGGSQSDIARLKAEDVDWKSHVVSFFRSKTGTAQIIHFGNGLAEVFQDFARARRCCFRVTCWHGRKTSRRVVPAVLGRRMKASLAFRSIPIGMRGPNGQRPLVILNALLRSLWVTIARPCIELMQRKLKSSCHRWRNTNRKLCLWRL